MTQEAKVRKVKQETLVLRYEENNYSQSIYQKKRTFYLLKSMSKLCMFVRFITEDLLQSYE